MRRLGRWSLVLTLVLAGTLVLLLCACGASHHATSPASPKPVRPRRILSTFSDHHILLINTLIYTNRDKPIIRAYDIDAPGQLGKLIANVFVYATVGDAIEAKKLDHSPNDTQRANIVVFFTHDASNRDQLKIITALDAATTAGDA